MKLHRLSFVLMLFEKQIFTPSYLFSHSNSKKNLFFFVAFENLCNFADALKISKAKPQSQNK